LRGREQLSTSLERRGVNRERGAEEEEALLLLPSSEGTIFRPGSMFIVALIAVVY
jgi:hypothetical protein